ncbi:MAG: hypothetical protein ABIL49_04740 [candidate division WOR-3 bacterium]|jgi:hypothetical protein
MNRCSRISFLNDNKFWFKEVKIESYFEIDSDKLFVPYFYYSKSQIISTILSYALENYKLNQIAIFDFQKPEIVLNFEELLDFFLNRISNSKENFIVILSPEFLDKYDVNLRIYRLVENGKLKIRPILDFRSFYEDKIKFQLNRFLTSIMMFYDIREKFSFLNTFFYIIENMGKPFNFRQAVIDLNIRFETLKNFIDYLQKAFLIRVLEEEESPRAIRTIIFNDWRVYNYLMNFSKRELLLNEIHKGAILSYEFLKAILENKQIKIDSNLNVVEVI